MILAFLTVIVAGFTACAEFGSYAWVHPVIRRLPPNYHIQVEQGLVKSFGRAMPVLMILSTILSVSYTIRLQSSAFAPRVLALGGTAAIIVAVISTVIFNVPRNAAVLTWDPENLPSDWKKQRNTWEFFQGVRSWLLLLGFVLDAASVTL